MKLVFTLVLLIAFNYAVTVESDKHEIYEMLEDRATLADGQGTSETSSLLQKKNSMINGKGQNPVMAMIQKKKAGGGGASRRRGWTMS